MKPRKVRKCSSVVLKEFAIHDDAANVVKDAISKSKEIKLGWSTWIHAFVYNNVMKVKFIMP